MTCVPTINAVPIVPTEVTLDTITKSTISNAIFPTFEVALECSNLLAKQENLPNVTKGNGQGNSKRAKCSGCSKQFMTFSICEPTRLLDCKSLGKFLSSVDHPCRGDSHNKLNFMVMFQVSDLSFYLFTYLITYLEVKALRGIISDQNNRIADLEAQVPLLNELIHFQKIYIDDMEMDAVIQKTFNDGNDYTEQHRPDQNLQLLVDGWNELDSMQMDSLWQEHDDRDPQIGNTQMKEDEKCVHEESNNPKSELENGLKEPSDNRTMFSGSFPSLVEALRDCKHLYELLLDQQRWSEESVRVAAALEAGSKPLQYAREKESTLERLTILENKASEAVATLSQVKSSLEAQLTNVQRKLVWEVAAVAQLQSQQLELLETSLEDARKLSSELRHPCNKKRKSETSKEEESCDSLLLDSATGSSITTGKSSIARQEGDFGSTSNSQGSPLLPTSSPFPCSGPSSSDAAQSNLFQWLSKKLKSKPKTEFLSDIRMCVQSIVEEGIPDELNLTGVSPDDVATRYLKSIGVSSVSTQQQLQQIHQWLIQGQRPHPTTVQENNETLDHADAAAEVASSETAMLERTITTDERDTNVIDEVDLIITIANALDTRKQMMRNVRTILEKLGLFPAKEQRVNAVASGALVVVKRNEVEQDVQELTDRYARMEIETKNCSIC